MTLAGTPQAVSVPGSTSGLTQGGGRVAMPESLFPEQTLTGKVQEGETQRPQGAGLLLGEWSLNRFWFCCNKYGGFCKNKHTSY